MDDIYFGSNRNTISRLTELDARLVRRDEVMHLLQSGQKIKAIKMYREDTGASLADAKAAVERMELSGAAYPAESQQWNGGSQEYVSESNTGGSGLSADVELLVMQGRKIEAIKLYRQQTGLGLREAKEAIDQIDHTLRTAKSSSLSGAQPARIETGREPPNDEVRRYLQEGKIIAAIKAYRQQTGLSLKDAKDEIDRLK